MGFLSKDDHLEHDRLLKFTIMRDFTMLAVHALDYFHRAVSPFPMTWIEIIESAFGKLDTFLRTSDWWGRENEVVNLYAHRFLAEHASSQGPLYSLRQVGIEVAVRQLSGRGKFYVRKDLVIWPVED